MYIPKDLLPVEARENTLRKVEEVLSRFSKDGVPLLDPEEDMEVRISNACHIVRFPLISL
jgi:ATP-dependent RNA helicase DOB1